MLAWPRSAMIPPPGRPMFPSNSWRIDAARMIWTPLVWWVQPTAYANAVVRSRPELRVISSATRRNVSCGMPQTRSTISGV